jgi:triosephosphate isomerase
MAKIVSGNWKMNGSMAMIEQWLTDFNKSATEFEASNTPKKEDIPLILVCLPDIYLPFALEKVAAYNSKAKNFKLQVGAEDVHFEEKGAFTGNTSPLFLKEFGCKYTLVGHSERRQYQLETSETIAKKAESALKQEITPFVCVGEDLATRESGKHFTVVDDQVAKSTAALALEKFVIAYEPVWAIGTGKVPTEAEIDEMCGHIKQKFQNPQVLYGGSVKASNAESILHLKNVDGVLVGGASMKGEEFFGIVKGAL